MRFQRDRCSKEDWIKCVHLSDPSKWLGLGSFLGTMSLFTRTSIYIFFNVVIIWFFYRKGFIFKRDSNASIDSFLVSSIHKKMRAKKNIFIKKTKHWQEYFIWYEITQKTRLKSKRNLRNPNQNVQNPKKRFKQI